ncbi:C-type lectin-like, partial [Trinorchestia longiramus]
CPAPFLNIFGVGCIFLDVLGPNALLSFVHARKVCNSFWPTADLCSRPDDWDALYDFMDQADAKKVWMGVQKQNDSWMWLDGSPVNESDWGSYVLDQQPDGLAEGLYLPPDINCAFARSRSGPILIVIKPNLMDQDCKAKHHYICQI